MQATTAAGSESRSLGPIGVLLYSIKGAGLHYTGGGMTAYRMYSRAAPGTFRITLAHARADQGHYDLFVDTAFMGSFGGGTLQQWRVLRNSVNWVRAHAAEFDVFHGLHGYHVTARTAFEAQRRGLPAVIKIAMHKGDLSDKPGWKTLIRLPQRRRAMVRQLSGIVATSRAIVEELQSYGIAESRIARIPNGVDCALFRPPASAAERAAVRAAMGWSDRPVVLFSGVLNDRKQPHVLVEALDMLKSRGGVPCTLVLAGPVQDEAYGTRLRAMIARFGLERDVILSGFVDDMPGMMRAADVFALPSRSEGMPNALLEAMASGLPSIATPISGVTDLMTDGVHGRQVAAEPGPIADAIAEYCRSEPVRRAHGEAARQRVERNFSVRAVVEAYEAMFRRIIAGDSAAG